MISYHTTDCIHTLLGYYEDDQKQFEITVADIKDNMKYGNALFDTEFDDHVFFVAMDNDIMIGVLKFKVGGHDSFANPGFANWICFIDVRKEYRNQGISTVLRKMLFKYCADNDLNILSSGFTVLGHMYNLKGYIRLAKKYGVEYAYKDCIGHPNFSNFEGMDETEYRAYYGQHKPDFMEMDNVVIINKK